MKQNIFILAILLGCILNVRAQLQKVYGTSGDDAAQCILKASDSTYYLIGTFSFLAKIDSSGNLLWTKTILPSDPDYTNYTYDAVIADSSNFVVLGSVIDNAGFDRRIYVALLNNSGELVWNKGYGNTLRYCDPASIIRTKDKGYVIVGSCSLNDHFTDKLLVIRTDEFGNLIWSKTYGGPDVEQGYTATETEEGNLIIVGGTASYGNNYRNLYILNLDAQGDTIWTRSLGGEGYEVPSSIEAINEDEFIIAGTYWRSGSDKNYDYKLFALRINANGDITWIKSYGGNGDDIANSIIKDRDGNYMLIGSTYDGSFWQTDIYALRLDENGDTLWTRRYGGSASDIGSGIVENPNGYLLFGQSRSFSVGLNDFCLIETDTEGYSACRYYNTNTEITDLIWNEFHGCTIEEGCVETTADIHLVERTVQTNDMCDCIPPVADFEFSCTDGWVEFTDISTWAESWLWDFGNGDTSIEENPALLFPPESQVCLTVQNQCGSDIYCETFWCEGAIKDIDGTGSVKIYPNPVNDVITVEYNDDVRVRSLSVYNSFGIETMSIRDIHQNPVMFSTEKLSSGIYFIRIETIDNVISTTTIIIP